MYLHTRGEPFILLSIHNWETCWILHWLYKGSATQSSRCRCIRIPIRHDLMMALFVIGNVQLGRRCPFVFTKTLLYGDHRNRKCLTQLTGARLENKLRARPLCPQSQLYMRTLTTSTSQVTKGKDCRVALGLDFGTEEARAVLVALDGSGVVALGKEKYKHGQITRRNANVSGHRFDLPSEYALQHPQDWLDAASAAVDDALADVGPSITPQNIVSIGVDFTSCTMVPCIGSTATPMCLMEEWYQRPHAWPKLWKHHGAASQADRLTVAVDESPDATKMRTRLADVGGVMGMEWLLPKALEIYDKDRAVYDAMETWVEAGDWLTWQLISGCHSMMDAPRSACQAGYKALWNATDGYPSAEYLNTAREGFESVLHRIGGHGETSTQFLPPGTKAGGLRCGDELVSVRGYARARSLPLSVCAYFCVCLCPSSL